MVDPTFSRQLREVALERVRTIRGRLARAGPEHLAEALREAHTLKGEARITGRGDVATLAHDLEAALERGDAQEAIEARLHALEVAVGAPVTGGAAAHPSFEHALLRVELSQVAELTRACSELRALVRATASLARELASLAAVDEHGAREEHGRRLRGLSRRARELAFEQDHRTTVLERDLRELRMLPIARLFEPLALAARQIAGDLGKPLEVLVDDGGSTVDRQVLDTMSEPLLHLVRNAVDHGIEPIDERLARGKPVVGTVHLRASQAGRTVRLEVADDGAGIDPDAIRRALVERGAWTSEQARARDREAVLAQLFEPAFSTRGEASEVSGRGLGLDIVRRRTEALGGTIRLETTHGEGTRFILTAPVSLVADPVVPVEVDGARYAFASSDVVAMSERSSLEVTRAAGTAIVRIEERTLSLCDLGELLGGEPRERGAVVALRADGDELALAVDRLLPVTATVRQGLDPFLEGLALVRATVALDGRLVTLLDARELLRRTRRASPSSAPASLAPPVASAPRVLVVDDSELTRDVLVSALEQLGCRVAEAVNGARALERLAAERFDLVLTDIDMPELDGLALLARIRATPQTARLPVIVLTTRAEGSFLARASELGADAYLTKAEFRTDALARLLAMHVDAEAVR